VAAAFEHRAQLLVDGRRAPVAVDRLDKLLTEYGPDVIGICYDCGHGNIGLGRGLDHMEALKARLAAVHLHDNDGVGDKHWVPFTGTVDAPRLTRLLATSGYRGCISLESNINNIPEANRGTFVADAFQAATRLTKMVAAARQPGSVDAASRSP